MIKKKKKASMIPGHFKHIIFIAGLKFLPLSFQKTYEVKFVWHNMKIRTSEANDPLNTLTKS